MASQPLNQKEFNQLINMLNQETDSSRRKLEILFESNNTVSPGQVAKILKCIGCAPHKIQAISILEPRLESMTCKEAKEVIGTVSIHKDKIDILECIKNVLTDNDTKLGEEYILSSFPYEHDKNQALKILNTVRPDRSVLLAAGGHQGYAALGGLFTQARPLHPHLYGSIQKQALIMEDKSKAKGMIPLRAKSDYMNSTYATSHPPLPYIKDKTYQEERGYPGSSGYPANINNNSYYPSGAPPLHMSGGSPAPTGYYNLERSAYVQNYS